MRSIDIIYEYLQRNAGAASQPAVGLTTQQLADRLGLQRTNISTLLNKLVADGKVEKDNHRPVRYRVKLSDTSGKEVTCFAELIGFDGSLQQAVQLAKAAILYPDNSLNVMLVGPLGCGISYFANIMYKFACQCQVISTGRFLSLNLINYESDSSALARQLFGSAEEPGLLAQAEGGMLFIENVQKMDRQNREELFKRIVSHPEADNNTGRRSHVQILMGIDSQNASEAMMTYWQTAVPVKIVMPKLADRPLAERLQLIQRFVTIEAIRSQKTIIMDSEALRGLLLFDCSGEIRRLNTDIKVGYAQAFVRGFNEKKDKITVYLDDFEPEVRKGLLNYKRRAEEVEALLPANFDYEFTPGGNTERYYTNYRPDNPIYANISKQFKELNERGLPKEDVDKIIRASITASFDQYRKSLSGQVINTEHLSKLVDVKVIEMVKTFLDEAQNKLDITYSQSVYYGLCLHVNALLVSRPSAIYFGSEQITALFNNFPESFKLAQKFAARLNDQFGVELSLDEEAMLAMFIAPPASISDSPKPQVLIAMHGEHAASEVAAVINELVKADNCHGFDMSLDCDTKQSYQQLLAKIRQINTGGGLIVIYDMGSLKTMLESASAETGIEMRLMMIPITMIGLDAARKCTMENDLDVVYHQLKKSTEELTRTLQSPSQTIIALCNTGQGGAVQIKEYIDAHSHLNLPVIAMAQSDRKLLSRDIKGILTNSRIKAIVGTYDPQLYGIPFIPVNQIFAVNPDRLDQVLNFQYDPGVEVDWEAVFANLHQQLPDLDVGKLHHEMYEFSRLFEENGIALDLNQQMGLILHIAGMADLLQHSVSVSKRPDTEQIIEQNADLTKILKPAIKKLEKAFNIIIPYDEIANIICIIRKL